MVLLPDGAKFEMAWRHIKYMNHGNYIIFQIIPKYSNKDIIIIPNMENWKIISSIFSFKEREKLIFLLERINWKRNIKIIELDILPQIDQENKTASGSLECAEAYILLTEENLFDNNSKLEKEQVKSLYLAIEKRFAENIQGTVNILNDLLLDHSVMKEFVIPILNKNENASINIV